MQTQAKHQNGFSLVELMIAIAIVGILASYALPAFRNFILDQRVKTATSNFYAALVTARSEAMKRNASTNLNQIGGNWTKGWTVTLAGGGVVLTQNVPKDITVTELNGLTTVVYSWTGRPAASSIDANFVLSASGVEARCVSLSLSGMPRITVDTDRDATNGC